MYCSYLPLFLFSLAVNTDGTLSRIENWLTLTEREQALAMRRVAKRNQERLATLRAAGSEATPLVLSAGGVFVGVLPASAGVLPAARVDEALLIDNGEHRALPEEASSDVLPSST